MTRHWHDDECGWCPCDEPEVLARLDLYLSRECAHGDHNCAGGAGDCDCSCHQSTEVE